MHEHAGEETTGRFTAHRGRVTVVARLPASQGAELLVTAGGLLCVTQSSTRSGLLAQWANMHIRHQAHHQATRVRQARTARRGCGSCRRKPPATPRRMLRRLPPSERTARESPSAQCSRGLWPCTGAILYPLVLALQMYMAVLLRLVPSQRFPFLYMQVLPMQLSSFADSGYAQGSC